MKDISELIQSFLKWYQNDTHSDEEDAYKDSITLECIEKLSKEAFIEFFYQFAYDGGKVQSQGYRTASNFKSSIELNYPEFRKRILDVFSPSFDLAEWLSWTEGFKYFGQGLVTIFLNRVNKHQYIIVNTKSIGALNALGFDIKNRKLQDTYFAIHAAEQQLIDEYPELDNFYRVDSFTHFLLGTDEGKALLKKHNQMEFFTQEELESLKKWAKTRCNREENVEHQKAYNQLSELYAKVQYWAQETLAACFPKGKEKTRKSPTNQRSNFEEYQWSKIYPTEKDFNDKWLAFAVSVDIDGFFEVRIDTVGEGDETELRKAYLEYRGEYDNSSPIIQRFTQEEILSGNWEDLIAKSKAVVEEIKDHYDIIKKLIGTDGVEESEEKYRSIDHPLNTIFYGPPGTGKTYHTVLRAAEIIENRVIEDYKEAKKIFNENLHKTIEFITFHQNYSYEDFIQGLRPDVENGDNLIFKKKDGVFKELADTALKNLREFEQPKIVKKPFFEVFNEFIRPMEEGEQEEIEVKMKQVSFHITGVLKNSIEFRKNSGGTGHNLNIHTLEKMYEAESIMEQQGLTSYYTPLLNKLLALGKDQKGKIEKVRKKNYVIIIDEINRANISRVFGELITLIEPDKRSHGDIPLEAVLPSGDKFKVPSNLYIIGTMNTADKSIALLDIALRRRFEFEAMYPQYEINGHDVYDQEILLKINTKIIKSKGHDFQIGHAYFMGENKDLVHRMNKKVIPLLLEYYMNDDNEVRSILTEAGLEVEENSWPLKIKGKRG